MFLKSLHVLNFRNYEQADLSFSEGVNCFVGNNGSGKTNLLEAIHYMGLCKSAFHAADSQNISHGKEAFVVQGVFMNKDEQDTVYCSFSKGKRKVYKRNQKEYERLADHIGLFPIVLISPEDTEILQGGSEERRRFIDNTLAQCDKSYLDDIVKYNKVLVQRNSLLKTFAFTNRFDLAALHPWDLQLAEYGTRIHRVRAIFLSEFVPVFQKYYEILCESTEIPGIVYFSQMNDAALDVLLEKAIDKDRSMQFTTVGIHKDDLVFTLDNHTIKKFGSQGQQKSFVAALKLAQFEYLKNKKLRKPLLLLDDIFDKLDDHRVHNLLELVGDGTHFGQIFLTDTHPQRSQSILKSIHKTPEIFNVVGGQIVR